MAGLAHNVLKAVRRLRQGSGTTGTTGTTGTIETRTSRPCSVDRSEEFWDTSLPGTDECLRDNRRGTDESSRRPLTHRPPRARSPRPFRFFSTSPSRQTGPPLTRGAIKAVPTIIHPTAAPIRAPRLGPSSEGHPYKTVIQRKPDQQKNIAARTPPSNAAKLATPSMMPSTSFIQPKLNKRRRRRCASLSRQLLDTWRYKGSAHDNPPNGRPYQGPPASLSRTARKKRQSLWGLPAPNTSRGDNGTFSPLQCHPPKTCQPNQLPLHTLPDP